MDGIDWTQYSSLCYDLDTDKEKLMKEEQLTYPLAEHDE